MDHFPRKNGRLLFATVTVGAIFNRPEAANKRAKDEREQLTAHSEERLFALESITNDNRSH